MGAYSHLLKQKITLKITNGTDENSAPIISETKTDVPCKIEYKNRLIVNAQSKEITSGAKIFLEEETIKIGDIVTVNSKDYPILQAGPKYDFDGVFVICECLI